MNVSTESTPPTEITFSVESDTDAARITAVLEALGYTVHRILLEGEAASRLAWAVERLGERLSLTPREQDVLAGILEGHDNEGLAQVLGVRKATVKWHLHNVFAKANVGNREALLRLALQLGQPGAGSSGDEGSSDAERVREALASLDEQTPRHAAGPDDITRRIE
ncbi:putative two component system response regulator [Plesiocystis pacifica SIR-1]|uniref:Putative two component system response regulator n=1 Tax=Plesiocystis pacifica SIR-1 TaxID=391625 RepID=A6G325_9BACT|nr:helix-turn-helix transcriptional regulator [Plesiocystis pacifica]EDM79650.1 putative two component system response regulator [Plesiocystis pacifica SIR-1]